MTMSSWFIVFFAIQEKVTQDDDESRGLWSSYATQKKQVDDELCNLLSFYMT